MNSASGIILAGGMSRRMGRDKAWIELGGRALIQRVIERLGQVCADLIVVANNRAPFEAQPVRVVGDVLPEKGALGGIYSGLRAAQYECAIVVACDMPFLNGALLDYMLTLADEYEVVVPSAHDASKPLRPYSAPAVRQGRKGKPTRPPQREEGQGSAPRPTAKDSDLHPLHAVYTRRCLAPIETRLRAGDLRMISFYPDVRVRVVGEAELERFDPRRLSLFNVNTPQQLALAQTLAEQEPAMLNYSDEE
jgi:molybdenum cofactor guanylyltransferase